MANLIKMKVRTEGGPFIHPCVYKMTVGKRYFIWKGKSLQQSLNTMSKDLERKIDPDRKSALSEDDLFYCMATYMRRFRIYQVFVDVLLETPDPEELLAFEAEALALAQGDPECCNQVFVPHVPGWIAQQSKTPGLKTPPAAAKPIPKPQPVPPVIIPVLPVEQEEVKPQPVVSASDLEMPDIDLDDLSDLLDSLK